MPRKEAESHDLQNESRSVKGGGDGMGWDGPPRLSLCDRPNGSSGSGAAINVVLWAHPPSATTHCTVCLSLAALVVLGQGLTVVALP